jgi:hypothetical protein
VSRPASPAAMVGAALVLLLLVLVQVVWLSALPTPAAVPDLVLVAVLAVAVSRGPLAGGLTGIWAGLLLDLVPPAAGPLAGWTLVLGGAGAALGRAAEAIRPGPFASMGLVAAGTGLTVLAREGVLWFAGDPVRGDALVIAVASAGYAVLLAPIALLVVSPRQPRATAPVRTVPPEVAAS